MDRQTSSSKALVVGMYTVSMLIAALWPVAAVGFGLTEAIWLTTGIGTMLSGSVHLAFAKIWSPKTFADRRMWRTARQTVAGRKTYLLPVASSAVEDLSYLMALRLIDPTVAQSILRFWPVAYSVWLWRTAKDRFRLSKAAIMGIATACLGAALVVIAAAGAEIGGGFYLLAGIGLIALTIAAIASKSQEIALVAEVGRRLGWAEKNVKQEQSLSIALSGGRNLLIGLLILPPALLLTSTDLPASFWWGNLLFGGVLWPASFILARYAKFLNSDLGLNSVQSAGSLATLGFAQFFGGVMVDNIWLLVAGMVFISLGSFITLIKHRSHLPHRR
ncbi:hypothetical protein F4X86_01390 [Candidatus Saccharibacteria bacterium]|nr:hypothetical protein [Candidatus Saccharibacteria bacterium]